MLNIQELKGKKNVQIKNQKAKSNINQGEKQYT